MFPQINKPYFGSTPTTKPFDFGRSTSLSNQKPFSQPFGLPGPTGGFGASPQPQTFGALTQKPGCLSFFDQPNKPVGFNFGTQANSKSLFGKQPFGQQPTSTFGGQQPTSTFGQQASSGSFGQFRSTPTQPGTVIKYESITGIDNIQKSGIASTVCTKLCCITCMIEYENKSLEELRWEDYQDNRKGSAQQPAATTSFLFGLSQSNPTFGFASSGFGTASQTSNQQGIFGKPSTNTFGTTATLAPTSMTTIKPFNTQQNFFGTTTTSNIQPVGFGASLVWQSEKPTTEGFFGKFTQTAATAQPNFSTFNQQNANLTSTFDPSKFKIGLGCLAPKTISSNTNFIQPTVHQQPTQTTVTQPFPFRFETTTPSLPNPFISKTASQNSCIPATNTLLVQPYQQQPQPSLCVGQQFEDQLQVFNDTVQQVYQPFPRRNFLKAPTSAMGTKPEDSEAIKEFVEKATVQVTPRNACKVRPVPKPRGHLYVLLNDATDRVSLPGFTRKSTGRCLMLGKTKPKTEEEVTCQHVFPKFLKPSDSDSDTENWSLGVSGRTITDQVQEENFAKLMFRPKGFLLNSPEMSTKSTQTIRKEFEFEQTNKEYLSFHNDDSDSNKEQTDELVSSPSHILLQLIDTNSNLECDALSKGDSQSVSILYPQNPCGIKLNKPEYYTIPPLNELEEYRNDHGECIVMGFTIGRLGYGKICFPDAVDVSNLDLDNIIDFQYREVTVYPDDTEKPAVGQGLNRRAQVTLEKIWPLDKSGDRKLKEPEEIAKVDFSARLELLSKRQNATFVDYLPETGSWVFMVEHFSKFRFDDAEDEVVQAAEEQKKQDNDGKPNKDVQTTEINGQKNEMGKQNSETENQGKKTTQSSITRGEKLVPQTIRSKTQTHFYDSQTEEAASPSINTEVFDERTVANSQDGNDITQVAEQFSISPNVSPNIALMKSSFFVTVKYPTQVPLKPHVPTTNLRRRTKVNTVKHFPLLNRNRKTSILSPHTSRDCADASIFKGRSFKVGWGHGFKFVTISNTAKLQLLYLGFNQCGTRGVEGQMQITFNTSTVVQGNSEVPWCIVKDGWESLLLYQNNSSGTDKEVWDLCLALWGPRASTPSIRRDLFSKWLENITGSNLQLDSSSTGDLFTLLSVHQMDKAAQLAMELGLANLAALISQSGSQETTRVLMYNQMKHWRDTGALDFIDEDILKVYMLLGGISVVQNVNLCGDLDWKRALAVHFWYMCPNGTSLINAVKAYQRSFQEFSYAQPPNPAYYSKHEPTLYDLLYHVMVLYSQPSSPMDKLLNPATHTEDPLDYRLSWLLLHMFDALKVGRVPPNVADSLHISFSSQLENMGLWKWAVFVLQFIEDVSVRTNTIMGVLDRNISSDCTCQDSLVNDFKIPGKLIHMILAERTGFYQSHVETYGHLICSGDWFKAHTVALSHLVPECMASKQYAQLNKLLENLASGKLNVSTWNTGIGLVLDILQLQREVTGYGCCPGKLQMGSKLTSLCHRMKHFPTGTPIQMWAAAELSRLISILIQFFYCSLLSRSLSDLQVAVTEIEQLPMPPDYKFAQLRGVTQHLIN